MKKTNPLFKLIKEGDVVQLKNGRVFRARSSYEKYVGIRIIWMDGDEETYVFEDIDIPSIESILDPTPEIIFTFNSTRSVHLRLNRLGKV